MLDHKDLRQIIPPPIDLIEKVRTKVTISKVNQINPVLIHQSMKLRNRTGRLIFDYHRGGIANITFEAIEHIKD